MAGELSKFFQSEVDGRELPFEAYCDLDQEADALMVFYHPDAYFSKRLTDHVTLYLAMDDPQKIIGCRIKGIGDLLEDLPNYLAVDHGGIKLSLIFLSFRGGVEDDQVITAFNELARAAGDLELSTS
jgi:hypothetical protein